MDVQLQNNGIEAIKSQMADLSMENHSKIGPIDFDRLIMLGKGGYGRVYLVRKTTGQDVGELYAMKVIPKSRLRADIKDHDHIHTEREVLINVQSPFLCSLQYSFQTSNQLVMVMDYMAGGEMFTHMERMTVFREPVARFYLAEVLLALEHLHRNNIVYRDLKPDNIMISRRGHIKLTDFGMCKSNLKDGELTYTFCGTVEYMSPEIVRKKGHTKVSDFWSFGGLMYDMLVGNPPFVGDTKKETMTMILRGSLKVPKTLSASAIDLLKKLLTRKPEERIGASEIKRHEFFETSDWDEIERLESQAPFVPVFDSDDDTSWFDGQFTGCKMEDPEFEQLNEGFEMDMFEGFEYCNPIFENQSSNTKSK